MSTTLEAKPRTAPPARARNYKVLLHNDDVNDMGYVVKCLLKCVPQLSPERAVRIMHETHLQGTGLVIVCDQEPAEFYSESLKSCGLRSSIEPD